MMDDKSDGQMTARVAEFLYDYYDNKVYGVIHDHGFKNEHVGEIVSWIGSESDIRQGMGLSQLDIAVYEINSKNVVALIEIEETEDKPKILLGDVFAALLGKSFTFPGKRPLNVGYWTTLIVLGKGSGGSTDEAQIGFLRTEVNNIYNAQPVKNWSVGKVILEPFIGEEELKSKLINLIDEACDRAKQPIREKGEHFFSVANLDKASPEERREIIRHIVEVMDAEEKKEGKSDKRESG
jgi:hypothetical protein